MTKIMMVANIEGLAGFTKRNRRSCETFYARREKTFGATVLAKTVVAKLKIKNNNNKKKIQLSALFGMN